MRDDDLKVPLDARPKKPTTMSPFPVVVTEGATARKLSGLNAPLCESTGADFWTSLKSRIAPAAFAGEAQDQL
jgi:hypothetical protein